MGLSNEQWGEKDIQLLCPYCGPFHTHNMDIEWHKHHSRLEEAIEVHNETAGHLKRIMQENGMISGPISQS